VDDEINLYFHSDSRTCKIDDLNSNSNFAVVMYHKSKKVQIRVTGKASVHQEGGLVNDQWQNVTGNGKKAYSPLISPGSAIESPGEAHEWPDSIDGTYFSVIKATPETIEVLQLNKMEHLRAKFTKDKDGNWTKKWIAP